MSTIFSRLADYFGGASAAPEPAQEQRNAENPSYSLDDPALYDTLLMSGGNTAEPVSPQRAVQTSAVYACVRLLSETLASIPLHVYERSGENLRTVKKALDHPIYQLLHSEPNSYQSSYNFREQLQAITSLWGNSYAEIQRDLKTGLPIAFHPLPAGAVQSELRRSKTRIEKVHRVGDTILPDEDMLQIPAFGWDGVGGVSPIALHRATLNMSLGAEEFGAGFYRNGTRLSGVLEHPSVLSADAAARMRKSWSDVYAGKANAGKVAVLEEGMKFTPLTMPLADAEFLATRKFQVNDIARIFRVPPHMIGDLEKATFSNIEQQSMDFIQNTVEPWFARWEQELNRKLIPKHLRHRFYVRFDRSLSLRGDIKSRYDAYAIGRQWGWLSANDVLEKEDGNEIEGGDIYLTPMNMVKVGAEDNTPKAEPAPAKGPEDQPTTPPEDNND